MRFIEDDYEITIWHEFNQFDGRAMVVDRPGSPVIQDPIQTTIHINAKPMAKIEFNVLESEDYPIPLPDN